MKKFHPTGHTGTKHLTFLLLFFNIYSIYLRFFAMKKIELDSNRRSKTNENVLKEAK